MSFENSIIYVGVTPQMGGGARLSKSSKYTFAIAEFDL